MTGFKLFDRSLLLAVAIAVSWYGIRRNFMRVRKVCQRWGTEPFDIEAFKSSENDESIWAGMACSLLKNQDDYTEMAPTYVIETARTQDQNTWQIVFRINRSREVKEIVVHKNCR